MKPFSKKQSITSYESGMPVEDIGGGFAEATDGTVIYNNMAYALQGSGGSHMSATWEQVWELSEESDAVESYDMESHEITWCDGSKTTPVDASAAISEIDSMSAC